MTIKRDRGFTARLERERHARQEPLEVVFSGQTPLFLCDVCHQAIAEGETFVMGPVCGVWHKECKS